jgi:hypothetical protein
LEQNKEGGASMARYILKDEKYSKDPMVFASYKEMIDKVRALCKKKGKEFNEKNEKDLKYNVETILE